MAELDQAIFIKKIKKGGHGHHGGAWKVAFADFAVAMMAFFLLMWLLASTTTQQQATISSYFNDPLATTGYSGNGAGNPALNGGDGILDGRGANPFTGKSDDETAISHASNNGASEAAAEAAAEAAEHAVLAELLEDLRSIIDAGKALEDFADQLMFALSAEGLQIQIVDKENRAMFDQGSAILQPYTREILREIVAVIEQAPNRISISGHTDAKPYASSTGYSNWELSADRANAARRELIAAGLPEGKIGRVVGLGPSDLLDPSQPEAPINRRISIVVLRGDHGKRLDTEEDADVVQPSATLQQADSALAEPAPSPDPPPAPAPAH